MAEQLRNKRIAALVDDGFEQSELLEPKKALEDSGRHSGYRVTSDVQGEGMAAYGLGPGRHRGLQRGCRRR